MPERHPLNPEFDSDPVTLLEAARAGYVQQLGEFRHQMHTGIRYANDHLRLADAREKYTGAFGYYLDTPPAILGGGNGVATIHEIQERRDAIAEAFTGTRVHTDPNTDLVVAGSALTVGMLSTIESGSVWPAVGGAIVSAVFSLGFRYRRDNRVIVEPVIDNDLTALALQEINNNANADPDQCLRAFQATLDTEQAAAMRIAARLLRTRTYTPVGIGRLAMYRFVEYRKAHKTKQERSRDNKDQR